MRASALIECVLSAPSDAMAPVRLALVREAELPRRLLELCAPPTPTPVHLLPCCHAFCMSLAGCLLTACQRDVDAREVCEATDGWPRFISPGGGLVVWEQDNAKPLGGKAPSRDDADSDEESDFDMSVISLQVRPRD